ncbi:MAG: hypothetical protein N2652_03355 [Kiritimatiellae bacterium]|nr:hypothetical protein [Kiritimatiellia bacterium]
MKSWMQTNLILVGLLTLVVGASAQAAPSDSPPPADAELELTQAEPWRVSVEGLSYLVVWQHDALQTRADYEEDRRESWRDGDVNGNGWGLRLAVGRGDGALSARFIGANYDYERREANGHHEIESDRNDLEILWSQRAGAAEHAEWGWELGYRYLGITKRVDLREGGDRFRASENVNWHFLEAGYFGRWRPFKGPNLGVYALVRGMLGEARGLARQGSDHKWDGDIKESYRNDYSLAYGARGEFGVDWMLRNGVRASVSYHREWAYSFDSTESGLVVFPDNSDALFIENVYAVVISVGYMFQ